MLRANRFYGHRGILAEYAGVPTSMPAWGEIQHGWGYGLGGLDASRSFPFFQKFVWGERSIQAAAEQGLRRVVPIGAPFLYLARLMEGEDGSQRRPDGTLAYPFHGWEEAEVVGDHEAYARELAAREAERVTVVLYWLEYEQPEIRTCYERFGLRVTCHGHRSDQGFLHRQYAALTRHRRVVTNRVATALWYGALLGREVEVYGPPMTTRRSSVQDFAAVQRREWPDMCKGGLAGEEASALARKELGARYVREPEELRGIMGWHGPRAAMGRLLSARDGLLRRAILRGLLWDRWHPSPPETDGS